MSIDDGLRSLFRKHVPPPIHWLSVEVSTGQRGVPDSNFCVPGEVASVPGVDGWIEFKSTRGWEVTLRPEQVGWILTRERHGGRVFVAVRRRCEAGPRRVAADELWMFRGTAARELRDSGLRAGLDGGALPSGSLLGCWLGGPARWPWATIRGLLAA